METKLKNNTFIYFMCFISCHYLVYLSLDFYTEQVNVIIDISTLFEQCVVTMYSTLIKKKIKLKKKNTHCATDIYRKKVHTKKCNVPLP